MQAWAIRLRGTNKWLTAKRGSFSFDEPKEGTPRLHLSKRSAQNTLTTWLLGRAHWKAMPVTYDSYNGEYDGGDIIKTNQKVPTRLRENMEIVEFELIEKEPQNA